MMKDAKDEKAIRCRHCGGIMRLYRGGISCMMCGRSLEHSCEYCKYPDQHEVRERKVA